MVLKREISIEQIVKLLEQGETDELDGFISNKDVKFKAALIWNDKEKKIDWKFSERKETSNTVKNLLDLSCVACGEKLIEYEKFIGCSGFKKGCRFSIPKISYERALSNDHIQDLISKGKTEIIKGFKGDHGTFDGFLYVDEKEKKVKIQVQRK